MKAAVLSEFHPPETVAMLCQITPYVAGLIARYRERPFPRRERPSLETLLAVRSAPPEITNRQLCRAFGVSRRWVQKVRQGRLPRWARQALTPHPEGDPRPGPPLGPSGRVSPEDPARTASPVG